MPETPEELWQRVRDDLRTPPVETWETWPFEGPVRPRALQPPIEREPPRAGAGGVDCPRCAAPDEQYVWAGERWRLRVLGPTGVPMIALLEPRAHVADPGDLSDDLAGELGRLLARIERAIRSLGELGRVHVCRWGDGVEHLHWWFIARPARLPQVSGSLVVLWDDLLPPVPDAIWHADVERLRAALAD